MGVKQSTHKQQYMYEQNKCNTNSGLGKRIREGGSARQRVKHNVNIATQRTAVAAQNLIGRHLLKNRRELMRKLSLHLHLKRYIIFKSISISNNNEETNDDKINHVT